MTTQLFKFLNADVPPGVLATKLLAAKVGVNSFTTSAASSDVVTTQITAAATTLVPQTALNALGVYTGTIANSADAKRVRIRKAGTDVRVDDGAGDEVYGVLTQAAGVYTLSYKKGDGSTYTFAATSIDFQFTEVFNLYTLPIATVINMGLGGVIALPADEGLSLATQTFTLNGTDITNKYVTLSNPPTVQANTTLFVKGSGPQVYGDDYTMSTAVRVSWSTLGLDSVLVAGDKLIIQYWY